MYWSGFKQKKIEVDPGHPGCRRCVNVTVIMERHPILICRFKLSPARPPPLFLSKELGGWFSLLKQPNLILSLLHRCVNPPQPNIFFLVRAPTLCCWSYRITVESILIFIPLYKWIAFIPLFSPPNNWVSYGSTTPLHTYDMEPYSYLYCICRGISTT
jgi:hypothetical protein